MIESLNQNHIILVVIHSTLLPVFCLFLHFGWNRFLEWLSDSIEKYTQIYISWESFLDKKYIQFRQKLLFTLLLRRENISLFKIRSISDSYLHSSRLLRNTIENETNFFRVFNDLFLRLLSDNILFVSQVFGFYWEKYWEKHWENHWEKYWEKYWVLRRKVF